MPAEGKPVQRPDAQTLEECEKNLPQGSIEAEAARDKRLMDQWDFSRLAR